MPGAFGTGEVQRRWGGLTGGETGGAEADVVALSRAGTLFGVTDVADVAAVAVAAGAVDGATRRGADQPGAVNTASAVSPWIASIACCVGRNVSPAPSTDT